MKTTPENIQSLNEDEIFVFGSNSQGLHVGGAAKLAHEKFGAIMRVGRGLQGKSYAIDTMTGIEVIKKQVEAFISFVKDYPKYTFLVTEIGCGIAGYKPEEIAPLFKGAVNLTNIALPLSFKKLLGISNLKGYKIFDSDFQCRGHQFSENSRHTIDSKPIICNTGFHFCIKASDCFAYYSFDPKNIVCEVEAYGEISTHNEDSKVATNDIWIGKRLTWEEVLFVSNQGANNTGHSNTGYSNTGDSNTGYRNTGGWNTGDRNTGDSNTGGWNTGDRNTGDRNTGDSNTGYRNTGYRNTGDSNTGYWNTGYRNTGDRNTGDSNTGYRNTGDRNTGYWNTGDSNTGYWNTGDSNTGYRNTGGWNTGDSNTGYCNTGDSNTGVFCTGEKYIKLFNKESKWTEGDFKKSPAYNLLQSIDTRLWVPQIKMSDYEKKQNIGWKNAEGFYRDIPFKESFQNAWNNWDNASKKAFTSLPNFSKKIFKEITGVTI